MDLEANHSLDVNRTAHIWLLHHLFLLAINQDATDWASTWNSHKLQTKGQCEQSPPDMFFLSMLQRGLRGTIAMVSASGDDEMVNDIASYSINWEVGDDKQMMSHLLENNLQDWSDENPFTSASTLGQLSKVLYKLPNCPFNDA